MMNREVTPKDKAAVKRGFNEQAIGLEKVADAAEKACAVDRGLAAAALYAAEGNEAYAKQCRQQARQFRELAKEL